MSWSKTAPWNIVQGLKVIFLIWFLEIFIIIITFLQSLHSKPKVYSDRGCQFNNILKKIAGILFRKPKKMGTHSIFFHALVANI